MISDGIKIDELKLTPVNVIDDDTKIEALDPFNAIINGVRTRVYPGTGIEVAIGQLGEKVYYVGDSVGLGDVEKVDLVDTAGNWISTPLAELFTSTVWTRLSEAARERILTALRWSDFANTVTSEVRKVLPADVATACLSPMKGACHE